MSAKQAAFKNRKNHLIAYRFENGVLYCSNGEQITKSANEYRKRTAKGDNLKVTGVTSANWKATARIHADSLGFFKSVDTLAADKLDINNLPQPEDDGINIYTIVKEWAKQ